MSELIKNIFLPEKIGNYYLFSKRVVGVDISKTSIKLTKTLIKKESAIIEDIVEEKLDSDIEETDNERISRTLVTLFAKIGKYNEIHTALPSSVVIFKELTLPFLLRDQISMIIGFEIEPLLPFPLKDAVIDFIITRQNNEEKSSDIIVTATQKRNIIEHIALFEAANLSPDVITVDMIALYSLYKRMPATTDIHGGTALIDIGLTTTHIALMIDAQLKMVRTVAKGVLSLAKAIAHDRSISPQEAMDNLLRFGLNQNSPDDTNAAHNAAMSLWKDINFTLVSFSALMLDRKPMTQLIFLGDGAVIHDLVPTFIATCGTSAESINIENLIDNKKISIKNNVSITAANIISVSCSLPSIITDGYNLRQKEFSPPRYGLLLKQLISCAVLTLGIFITLSVHYILQTGTLANEKEQSEKDALSALIKAFPDVKNKKKLSDAITAAQEALKKEQKTWFAYSSQSRALFLQCLLELTTRIDAKSLGFTMEQITIADGILTLKASVKDHNALKTLEEELRKSKLFSEVESQETEQFTMRIRLATTIEEL